MNVAIIGQSCATGLTVGEIIGRCDEWSEARSCAEEKQSRCQGFQCRLNVGDPIEIFCFGGAGRQNSRCAVLSMLLIITRAPCEVERPSTARSADGQPLVVATRSMTRVVGIIRDRETTDVAS